MEPDVDVVVVGGALGGLSSAMFLARRGVRVLLVERHGSTSIYPKAAGQNPRTMELLRIGGVAEEVMAATDIRGRQGDFTIKVAETVGGRTLHTFAESFEELVGATEDCTPMPWALASQDRVEPILLAQAEKHGADIRFGTEMTDFAQDDDGVTVRLRTVADGAETTVRGRYLVAADGPRSEIRERLGIPRHGHGSLAHFVGIIFDADLSAVLPPGSTGWYYLQNPAFTGTFGPTDRPDRHTFYVQYDPARGETPEDYPPERCEELIRLAVGAPDLRPVLLDVQAWEMAAYIADRWRDGRILLVGDAAKVTPPTGGMGGNTAVGDGFDVAWKLAAVVNGEAGEGLLDSYGLERAQVARLVVDESLSIYGERMAPHLADSLPRARGTAEVLMGFRYRSGAVVAEDDDPEPVENPLRPTGRPGFRAPHAWVERDGARVSTIELYGEGWTLIAGPEGTAWGEAAAAAARDLGVRLDVHVLGEDLRDPDGELTRRYGLGPAGATLVRPDGVVAWRSAGAAPDPGAAFRAALATVLSRVPAEATHG
ncbi:FAD-dependent monooxygenase [Nonomuraea roseoviolacea subsp. roseoviolacea]|uniref:Aklavinone 12-hydroxylase n=1 Tax=Nonomuraea roseoviolacea subsp. carminata TaxID=160689 RepID=A0ABT1JRT1_9ACTN|nr:FAD-dependent monooxygenase [Nonomuraea roseoviolacea]MCP2344062.1 aklavinone 12-hydroxylase [Nonomuraea roseoviolacea subsp. carminata]